jgi:hypothetical protein
MADFRDFDSDADETPLPKGAMTSNEQWMYGSIYAGLVLIGLAFGVYAGASRPKPVEVTENKKEKLEKPAEKPIEKPAPKPPIVDPKPKEPEPKEPEPKPKEPEPKPKEPEPKPKEPEPKPKEPEPKKFAGKAVSFKEVQPLLRRYCGECHGLAGKPKNDVDIRTLAAIKKGGSGGDILVPGDPAKSSLYATMISDGSDRMPPPGKPQPTKEEIKLIHDWIASGAKERRAVRGRRGLLPRNRHAN